MSELLLNTFSAYLADETQCLPSTASRYLRYARQFLSFLGGKTPLSSVSLDELLAFLHTRQDPTAPLSPYVWNGRISALKALFAFAQEKGHVTMNPTEQLTRKKVHPHERVPLSMKQMIDLIDAVEEHSPRRLQARNTAIVYIFLHSSLRASEVTGLRLSKTDCQGHTLYDVRLKGGEFVNVAISDLLTDKIEHWLAVRERYWNDCADDHLFLSIRGSGLSVRTVEDLVTRYAQLAGIPRHVFPHLLRHTSAHEYADVTDLPGVQEQLHHKDPKTTEHYIHRPLTKQREVVEKFAERWQREEKRCRRGRISPRENRLPIA